ncbi:Amino acid transporter, transmembrane [Corchorus olitorius]|uniref:Amino acid transporter, transmembrane n=1 Tax=Corchorus olitorius TaxID=93759 RepID=A0A1R3JQW3_9ROSI|nr:Amino acid transporter, transmembrane [Corchorus olitorius]
MKIDDDDFLLYREDAFQTDDEENQAERGHEDDDHSESDYAILSRNPSSNCLDQVNNSPWPQSYRGSMDMLKGTPPAMSLLGTSTSGGLIGNSSFRKRQTQIMNGDIESSSLNKPLISDEKSLDHHDQEVPATSFIDLRPRLSVSGLSLSQSHRQSSSFTQALVNGINVLSGIGLLTTPYAVKEGGWLSLLLLIVFGIIACYTGILLKRCLESSPGLHTYPDIGQAAFGVPGRLMISVILYAELYAACVEYVIMMSDNLSTLFPNTGIAFSGTYLGAHQVFSIIGTLIVLPTVWLRDLSLLSYLSVGGVGASILVVICLLWVGAVDQVGFHGGGTALNFANLPISVAISGFLIFGDSVESQFTLNMPIKLPASKIAAWTVVIITVSKYALTLNPIALSLEELVPSTTQSRSHGVSVVIRTALVISTLIVAMTLPFFAFVMALAGSLLAMLIAIIFPCACYLSIFRDSLTNLQKSFYISIAIFGLVTASFGTYSAILKIADQL